MGETFAIGDRVRVRTDSTTYEETHGVEGTVTKVGPGDQVEVTSVGRKSKNRGAQRSEDKMDEASAYWKGWFHPSSLERLPCHQEWCWGYKTVHRAPCVDATEIADHRAGNCARDCVLCELNGGQR
jgi:endonuclease YncB( thermonuclease family)